MMSQSICFSSLRVQATTISSWLNISLLTCLPASTTRLCLLPAPTIQWLPITSKLKPNDFAMAYKYLHDLPPEVGQIDRKQINFYLSDGYWYLTYIRYFALIPDHFYLLHLRKWDMRTYHKGTRQYLHSM